MTNIDFFNLLTLEVLRELYDAFPSPILVDIPGIAYRIVEKDEDVESEEGTFGAEEAARDAIRFLAEEGFLTFKGFASGPREKFAEGARLTLRGFAILGSTPTSLLPMKKKPPLIARIRAALGEGAKAVGKEAAKQLVQLLFASAIRLGRGAVVGSPV